MRLVSEMGGMPLIERPSPSAAPEFAQYAVLVASLCVTGLVEEMPKWLVYFELVFTTKEYMRQARAGPGRGRCAVWRKVVPTCRNYLA